MTVVMLLRRYHLLSAPLGKQRTQGCGLHRLVEHDDAVLARGVADMRAAVCRDQDGWDVFAETLADVADRCDAVAPVQMIVDQQAGDPLIGGGRSAAISFRVSGMVINNASAGEFHTMGCESKGMAKRRDELVVWFVDDDFSRHRQA